MKKLYFYEFPSCKLQPWFVIADSMEDATEFLQSFLKISDDYTILAEWLLNFENQYLTIPIDKFNLLKWFCKEGLITYDGFPPYIPTPREIMDILPVLKRLNQVTVKHPRYGMFIYEENYINKRYEQIANSKRDFDQDFPDTTKN